MYKLIQYMLVELFAGERRRLNATLAKIRDQNNEIVGQELAGFLFEGEFYSPKGSTVIRGAKHTSLDIQLHEAARKYLKDKNKVEEDIGWIRQGIFQILSACSTIQEIRDTLPECLVKMVPDLIKLERTAPAGSSLTDPLDREAFDHCLPKIQFYSAARLIY